MNQSDTNPQGAAHHSGTWVIPLLLILIFAACAGWFTLADRFGGGLAILAVVIVPVVLAVLWKGLSKGYALWSRLRVHFRWWHGLWFLAFASGLVFRVRGAGEIKQDPVDAWALYRISLEIVLAFILFMRLALRRTPWIGSLFRGFTGAIAFFGVVQLASTVWSAYPMWTLYKSCEYLLDIAILAAAILTVETVEDYRDFFNWTWALYGFLLLSVWMGVVLWPQEALYPQGFKVGTIGVWLTGIHPALSANDVATYAAMLALVSLSRLLPLAGPKSDRLWYGLLFFASAVTMILAQTRTAMAGFLFGVFLILYFSRRVGLSAFLTFAVMPLVLLSSVGGLIWAFLERGENSQELATLSNRTVWWGDAWRTFMDRPLTGFGAYAGGRFSVLAKIGATATSTLHSDFLEIIVGTGIWGLIAFLAALLGTWWFLTRHLRHSPVLGPEEQLAYEAVVVLGLLSFRSIFMTMLTWHPPLHFLAVIGYAEFLRRRRLQEKPARQLERGHIRGPLAPTTEGAG